MALPKPGSHIDWTDGAASKVEEPIVSKKLLGFVSDERPDPKHHNWLWYQLDAWVKYLESVTDEFGLSKTVLVGTGFFASIQAAHDDADTVPGTKIIVLEDQALAATVNITKANIEIELRSNVTLSDAGAGTGLNVGSSADGFKLKGGRVAGFSDPGDIGIEIAADADFCMLRDIRFSSNDTDIEENGNTSLSSEGHINE